MQQVIQIHGGRSFKQYGRFLDYLRTVEVEPFPSERQGWRYSLQENLGKEFEIILPTMPNKQNSKYVEWKIWFERFYPFLRDDLVLIGHSLGGMFLVRHLSENVFPKKIATLHLVAPVFDKQKLEEKSGGEDFLFDVAKLSNVEKQCGEIYIYHSKDDDVVSFKHAEEYKQALPEAELVVFEDRGHFMQEEFPELIERIRS